MASSRIASGLRLAALADCPLSLGLFVGYRASLRALLGWTVQARLGEIAAPTLALTADQDYTPVSWKEDYVARMPNARLRVIADCHHAMPVENPQPFNAALVEFLDAH